MEGRGKQASKQASKQLEVRKDPKQQNQVGDGRISRDSESLLRLNASHPLGGGQFIITEFIEALEFMN